jgi:hypothetical protein
MESVIGSLNTSRIPEALDFDIANEVHDFPFPIGILGIDDLIDMDLAQLDGDIHGVIDGRFSDAALYQQIDLRDIGNISSNQGKGILAGHEQ